MMWQEVSRRKPNHVRLTLLGRLHGSLVESNIVVSAGQILLSLAKLEPHVSPPRTAHQPHSTEDDNEQFYYKMRVWMNLELSREPQGYFFNICGAVVVSKALLRSQKCALHFYSPIAFPA